MAVKRLGVVKQHITLAAPPHVIVVGGIAVDIVASSFTSSMSKEPGKVLRSFGGVGRNIAENIARMGLNCALISAVGGDADGGAVVDHLKRLNVKTDCICVLPLERTGTFAAFLQNGMCCYGNCPGEQVAAVSDFAIFDNNPTPQWVDRHSHLFTNKATVVVDTNLPVESLRKVCSVAIENNTDILLEPVSVAKCRKVVAADILRHTTMISPNEEELVELCSLLSNTTTTQDKRHTTAPTARTVQRLKTDCAKLLRYGVKIVIVTRGKDPAIVSLLKDNSEQLLRQNSAGLPEVVREAYCTPAATSTGQSSLHWEVVDGVLFMEVAPLLASVVNVIGAGDAFMAGFAGAWVHGVALPHCVQIGLYAARECVQSVESVAANILPIWKNSSSAAEGEETP